MRARSLRSGFRGLGDLRCVGVSWSMLHHTAEERIRILAFWDEHGIEATTDAFGVSRRTLYRWRARLRKTGGELTALHPGSTAPKRRRQRQWPPEVVAGWILSLPRLGRFLRRRRI